MVEPIELTSNYLRIKKKAINSLPLRTYSGSIVLVDKPAQVMPAIEALQREKVLGFDTESRPAFRKGEHYPPSVLQLGGTNHVYLFQIAKCKQFSDITALLSSPATLKVGVAIDEDIKKLQGLNCFEPAGFIELSNYTRRKGILNTGLRSLVALYLGFRVSKVAQLSNWSHDRLNQTQIRYAATDAWACLMLYQHLNAWGIIP